jgi:hypothetical protein
VLNFSKRDIKTIVWTFLEDHNYIKIRLLFSGLCRGRLDCWVADVSIAMLLFSSELVNKLVWSIPCSVLDYLYG